MDKICIFRRQLHQQKGAEIHINMFGRKVKPSRGKLPRFTFFSHVMNGVYIIFGYTAEQESLYNFL